MLPKIDGWFAKVLVVALLAIQGVLLLDTACKVSETFDEPMYLLAARSYWATGDFSFNREHPPLTKLLIGAPLAWADLELPADYHNDGATQMRFVYELNDDPVRVVLLGRLPMVALGLLLSLYVYLWGRRFGGERTGVLALAACAFLPALLGNTPLAALDLGAAAFAFIALYHLAVLRERPGPWKTLAAGVTFGLAQLTKFSNALMGPVYVVIAVVDAVRERSFKPILRTVALFLVAFTTMFFGYGCEMRTVDSVRNHPRYGADTPGQVFDWPVLQRVTKWFGDAPVPMLTYLKGLDYLKSKAAEKGHASYYRGEARFGFQVAEGETLEGWPGFYLTSMAVKTPAGLLALLVMALLLYPALPHRPRLNLPLLAFPLLLFAYFSDAPSQLGIRYILPVLPACAVAIGRLVDLDPARHRRWLAGAGVVALVLLPIALAWEFRPEREWASGLDQGLLVVTVVASLLAGAVLLALSLFGRVQDHALRRLWPAFVAALLAVGGLETLARHPDHLMFFNAYAGGPANGWRILSVGDDWGQGAAQLAALQRERGWDEVRYDYYGTGIPDVYGLRYRPFNGEPTAGIVAVHVVQLTRERLKGDGKYDWFDGMVPTAQVGPILVFQVSPEKVEELRARASSG